jgi:hypothetical protein
MKEVEVVEPLEQARPRTDTMMEACWLGWWELLSSSGVGWVYIDGPGWEMICMGLSSSMCSFTSSQRLLIRWGPMA